MYMPKPMRVGVCSRAFPYNFVLKLIIAKNLIEHYFDVMARVPITVVIEGAGRLEHAR